MRTLREVCHIFGHGWGTPRIFGMFNYSWTLWGRVKTWDRAFFAERIWVTEGIQINSNQYSVCEIYLLLYLRYFTWNKTKFQIKNNMNVLHFIVMLKWWSQQHKGAATNYKRKQKFVTCIDVQFAQKSIYSTFDIFVLYINALIKLRFIDSNLF